MTEELLGSCVGLNDAAMKAAAQAFARSGLSRIWYGASTDLSSHEGLSQPGCVVSPLPVIAAEVRRLLDDLRKRRSPTAVIFLAAEIHLAAVVEAIRGGAAEVLAWPRDADRLDDAVAEAVRVSRGRAAAQTAGLEARRTLERLNRGERDVLEQMLAGRVNKSVASRLGIAVRTVENRRKQIFQKLGTRSLAEILRVVQLATNFGTSDCEGRLKTPADAPIHGFIDRAAG